MGAPGNIFHPQEVFRGLVATGDWEVGPQAKLEVRSRRFQQSMKMLET
jgi:hypothetical protein